MTETLNYLPGQTATIFLTITDGYGNYQNTSPAPIVNSLIVPGFTYAANYPVAMTQFTTGVYYTQITLPQGASSIGMYLLDLLYTDYISGNPKHQFYQINVNAPFGTYSAITF